MDIMELGAIGELVGGVAVIASLLYVGLQVRQSTIATRVGYQRSSTNAWTTVTTPLHSDAELSELFTRALDCSESLSRDARIRVHYLLLHIVNFFVDQVHAHQAGIIDDSMMRAWEEYIASVLAKPGGRVWWRSARATYPERIATRLTEAIEASAPYDSIEFLRSDRAGV